MNIFAKTALCTTAFLALGTAAPAFAAPALSTTLTLSAQENINAPYNDILSTYIEQVDGINLFDYGAVTPADRQKLADYVAALEAQKPSQMAPNDAIAYWANLYNAKTLEVILDNYPVNSIRNIKSGPFSTGPWKMKVLTVEGEELSLDDVEHEKVRGQFKEPRVHYAFNCASIGCPNLAMTAWEGASLDEDLDAAARDYIAHPRGIRVEGNRVIASSIFKWFRGDFGANDAEVLDHIRQYATGDKLEALNGKTRINKHEYDWDLNDVQ